MPVMGEKEAVMAEDQPNPFAAPPADPPQQQQDPPKSDPPPKDDPDDDTPANVDPAVKGVLAKERKAAREALSRATAAEAKLQEIADKDKSEQQRLTDRAEKAERELEKANHAVLRTQVAAEAGLPAKMAARLQGGTKEEMQADAKDLLADIGASSRRDPDQGRGDTNDPATGGGMSGWMRAASSR